MTRRFNFAELELIQECVTATKWAIEISMEAGASFEQAKADRIKQAEAAWRGLTPDMAQAVRNVAWSLELCDLSKRTLRAVSDRARASIEKSRGYPFGLVDRLLWRLFGIVW